MLHYIRFIMIFCLTLGNLPHVQAADIVVPPMPKPGVMVNLSASFTPAHLKGMTVHPDNALQFDFLMDRGENNFSDEQKKEEYTKLIKYFLASLTIADKDQWVNLSPFENNRIIENNFGKTEMGRDLLAQDYLLKQVTSSLMYPESGLGKKFWDDVYAKAFKELGHTNIPVNTINKVWIMPDEAVVYESNNTAIILKSHLKVMLEEDYLATKINTSKSTVETRLIASQTTNKTTQDVIRQIILPALEKEVNEGKNFAQLRQIVSAMILATWYKQSLKESLLGKVYADKSKVKGVDQDPKTNDAIYQQYLAAFKKGVYSYIKEDEDKYTNQIIPRKYFAGGFIRDKAMNVIRGGNLGSAHLDDEIAKWLESRNRSENVRVSVIEPKAVSNDLGFSGDSYRGELRALNGDLVEEGINDSVSEKSTSTNIGVYQIKDKNIAKYTRQLADEYVAFLRAGNSGEFNIRLNFETIKSSRKGSLAKFVMGQELPIKITRSKLTGKVTVSLGKFDWNKVIQDDQLTRNRLIKQFNITDVSKLDWYLNDAHVIAVIESINARFSQQLKDSSDFYDQITNHIKEDTQRGYDEQNQEVRVVTRWLDRWPVGKWIFRAKGVFQNYPSSEIQSKEVTASELIGVRPDAAMSAVLQDLDNEGLDEFVGSSANEPNRGVGEFDRTVRLELLDNYEKEVLKAQYEGAIDTAREMPLNSRVDGIYDLQNNNLTFTQVDAKSEEPVQVNAFKIPFTISHNGPSVIIRLHTKERFVNVLIPGTGLSKKFFSFKQSVSKSNDKFFEDASAVFEVQKNKMKRKAEVNRLLAEEVAVVASQATFIERVQSAVGVAVDYFMIKIKQKRMDKILKKAAFLVNLDQDPKVAAKQLVNTSADTWKALKDNQIQGSIDFKTRKAHFNGKENPKAGDLMVENVVLRNTPMGLKLERVTVKTKNKDYVVASIDQYLKRLNDELARIASGVEKEKLVPIPKVEKNVFRISEKESVRLAQYRFVEYINSIVLARINDPLNVGMQAAVNFNKSHSFMYRGEKIDIVVDKQVFGNINVTLQNTNLSSEIKSSVENLIKEANEVFKTEVLSIKSKKISKTAVTGTYLVPVGFEPVKVYITSPNGDISGDKEFLLRRNKDGGVQVSEFKKGEPHSVSLVKRSYDFDAFTKDLPPILYILRGTGLLEITSKEIAIKAGVTNEQFYRTVWDVLNKSGKYSIEQVNTMADQILEKISDNREVRMGGVFKNPQGQYFVEFQGADRVIQYQGEIHRQIALTDFYNKMYKGIVGDMLRNLKMSNDAGLMLKELKENKVVEISNGVDGEPNVISRAENFGYEQLAKMLQISSDKNTKDIARKALFDNMMDILGVINTSDAASLALNPEEGNSFLKVVAEGDIYVVQENTMPGPLELSLVGNEQKDVLKPDIDLNDRDIGKPSIRNIPANSSSLSRVIPLDGKELFIKASYLSPKNGSENYVVTADEKGDVQIFRGDEKVSNQYEAIPMRAFFKGVDATRVPFIFKVLNMLEDKKIIAMDRGVKGGNIENMLVSVKSGIDREVLVVAMDNFVDTKTDLSAYEQSLLLAMIKDVIINNKGGMNKIGIVTYEKSGKTFIEVTGPLGADLWVSGSPINGTPKGGIDLNAENFSLDIKRDGKGVALPIAQQDMEKLNRIEGFVPRILEIKPVFNLPILSELEEKLKTAPKLASST